jgi:hypothetical protein
MLVGGSARPRALYVGSAGGRLMKEWLAVRPEAAVDCDGLANEALHYVKGGR